MRKLAGFWVLVVFAWVLSAYGVASCQGMAEKMTITLAGGVKMDFVLIHPGSFMMGSMGSEPVDVEKPVHKVRITKPFYMGVYEVTQAQWKALMGYNPAKFKEDDDFPVESVSWESCQEFLGKFKAKLGHGMNCRLPTEAEWEYACRAGSQTAYYFGDEKSHLGEYAWSFMNADNAYMSGQWYGQIHPVGQKKPNAWGLFDMLGNVSEWCQDLYSNEYYANGPADDPKGPPSTETGCRVIRGGSGRSPEYRLRSAWRADAGPKDSGWDLGFRVVVSAQE